MEFPQSEMEKELLFHQTYLKALLENKHNTEQWTNYKEKYQEVIKNLQFYNEKHKHSVCIPLGNKAFVRGELVHTNDVWVTLGCGYFLKTSTKKAIEICERRIEAAEELIEKWEKENRLLESMRNQSKNAMVFGEGDDSKEIIEQFDEEKEKKWRERHREKEREYKQKLKKIKDKTGTAKIKDEKDVWEHLEALELQEELEDELNRLGLSEDELDSDDTSQEEEEEEEEIQETRVSVKPCLKPAAGSSEPVVVQQQKRVSFVEEQAAPTPEETAAEEEVLTAQPVLELVLERSTHLGSTSQRVQHSRPLSKFKLNKTPLKYP